MIKEYALTRSTNLPNDDDELFLWYVWPTKGVKPYFQPGPLPEIPHHHESPTRREQDMNLRRTWVQALLNELVQ